MSARYQATELTPTGYGRRFYGERLATVRSIIEAIGGEWRVRRQWKWNGRWSQDGGRDADVLLTGGKR